MKKDSNVIEGEFIPMEKQKSKKPVELIQKVDSPSHPNVSKESQWIDLLKSLNPLGAAKDAVSEFLYYRHQIKVLNVEQKRIEEEAKIRHHQIDAALEIAVKILDDRKNAIEKSFCLVSQELANQHIARTGIIESIKNLTNDIMDSSKSIEERSLSQTALSTMSEILRTMGEQSTANLTLIAQNTQKALDAIPQTRSLLTFSDD